LTRQTVGASTKEVVSTHS